MPSLAPGTSFGDYSLIRPLGKGGMAEVWEAESAVNGRRVALKALTELRAGSERGLERFQQEGRLAAALSSPHCVYVFGAGAVGDVPYIAMELMPGGTLADRLAAGPLAPADAVDTVLDVLDGLESAQAAGILHRDVKPSNVFLDAAGRAKIGDFGISKSLEVDSGLSQTGAFLGTPYYASPEQIAAEPLDLRSDLYSVGAMLYELVTGAVPYAGTNASQVLAQVLTREPQPFSRHAADVPAGLQRVILRLLAKPREKRYQTYEEARAALRPFSSRGLAPAGRLRRLGAMAIDIALFFPVGLAVSSLTIRAASHGHVTLAGALIPALLFAYFALTEGLGGASGGKRLLGLRVATASGATPVLWRVALRTLVFCALYNGVSLTSQLVLGDTIINGATPLQYLPLLLKLAAIGALLSTMRRANGYAGLHELASGTRTVALVARERPGPVPRTPLPLEPAVSAPAAYGPYTVTGTVWRRDGRALLVAHDATLHRDVWIDVYAGPAAAAAPPVERLRDRGAGSLTWLQRGAVQGGTWDAYGAPPGTPFATWAVERGGLPWREMREVLDSLAHELAARFERDATAGVASPDHVWLDPSGRALLLDFPVGGDPGGAVEITPATWRDFLARVTTLGFSGRPDATLPPRVPLPGYARTLLAQLEDGVERPLGEFVQTLDAAAIRPAEVTRGRRAGPFAVLGFVPALILLVRFSFPLLTEGMPPWYRDLSVNLDAYRETLTRADSAAATDSVTRRTAAAIRQVLAAAQLEGRRTEQAEAPLLRAMSPGAHAMLDTALARYPAPDSATVAAARAWVAAHVMLPRMRTGLHVLPKAITQGFTALAWLGAGGVVLALALRGGALFSLFGLEVLTVHGARAGRWRCAARALAGWAPLLGLLALGTGATGVSVSVGSASFSPPATTGPGAGLWERLVLVALALAGAAYAVWRPARGLAERISGTVLVPR